MYQTPARPFTTEFEIKKSRFVVDLLPLADDHRPLLEQIRRREPKAGHHCWAYRLNDGVRVDCSDDGEPRGTAGKPMLSMLEGLQIGACLAVISRYFGGIKLGTGGLVRAYSSSLRSALEACPMDTRVPQAQIRFGFPYPLAGHIESLRRDVGADLLESQFEDHVTHVWQVGAKDEAAALAVLQAQAHLGVVIYKQ